MKNINNTPEKFHILFECDWNKGVDSKMSTIQRGPLNDLFLEYIRWQVKNEINLTSTKEEVIQGFIDID
jgi:hypothetical protein